MAGREERRSETMRAIRRARWWLVGSGAALAPAAALAQERVPDWGRGMNPMWWMWGAGGIVMMLFMLLFWGLVIAGLVVGIRWLVMQGRGAGGPPGPAPPDRAARG